MNRHDRKALTEALDQMDADVAAIREIAEAQRFKFENLPEGLQESDAAQRLEEAAEALEQAADEIKSGIEAAREFAS